MSGIKTFLNVIQIKLINLMSYLLFKNVAKINGRFIFTKDR
jgi:hypothetical protein